MTAETAKRYAWLEQRSTEELERMLHTEAFSADSDDPELTDLILEVMVKRKKNQLPDPVRAKEDFDRLYRDLKEPLYPLDDAEEAQAADPAVPARPRIVRRFLIAAVMAALLVTMMSVPVFGYDSVFQMIGHWTAEQFGFRSAETPSDMTEKALLREVPEEYAELQTALLEKGIDFFLYPVVPEDFRMVESNLYTKPNTGIVEFNILYKNGIDSILLMIFCNSSSNEIYEKDDGEVTIYEHSGVEHYIFSNINNTTAAWYMGGLEYSIATDLSLPELKEIIDSMYEE